MPLPQVNITQAHGQLGRALPFEDRAALLCTSVAVAGKFLLSKTYTIYHVQDAETLGFSTTVNGDFLNHIKDFYRIAPPGTPLVIAGVPKATAFATLFQTDGIADRVLKYAGGKITLFAVSHAQHSGNYVYTHTDGLKGRIQLAPAHAHAFAARAKAISQPLHVLIGGYHMNSASNLRAYGTANYHHVSLLVSSAGPNADLASIGLVLAHLASLPPQRKLSRVRNGALPIAKSTFINGGATDKYTAYYDDLHSKRYLFFRTYPGKSGYYVADDCTLASTASDYASIAANRVINKAIRLAYQIFVNEIGEELQVQDNGTLADEAARYYEGLIENAIGLQMVAEGQLNAVSAFVDPTQQVIQNDKLSIQLNLQPVGYASFIEVAVGFSLSANT